MKNNRTNSLNCGVWYTLLFLLLYLVTYTEILSLRIGNATPIPLIAATVVVAFYHGTWVGFTAGLLTGIFMDAVASGTVCFNTIIMMIIGCVAGALTTYMMNKNIFSVGILSIGSCLLYFICRWLFFYFITGNTEAHIYLIIHAIPSAIYSALFIIPLFFIGKLISE